MKFINIEKDYFNVNDENMIIIEFQIQILWRFWKRNYQPSNYVVDNTIIITESSIFEKNQQIKKKISAIFGLLKIFIIFHNSYWFIKKFDMIFIKIL